MTRFASFTVDVVVILVLFAIGGQVADYVLRALDVDVSLADSQFVSGAVLLVWAFLYLAAPAGDVRPHVRHGGLRHPGGPRRRSVTSTPGTP